VYTVDLEMALDNRGYFARTFSRDEFDALGLNSHIEQCSTSYNEHQGTLRGLHYQDPPYAECKLVRCTRGSVYDVVADLRRDSPTYLKWHAEEIDSGTGRMVYVPEGVAHGFLTLEDHCEIHYQMSSPYAPWAARGIRWDDAAIGVTWPSDPHVISERDRTHPPFEP
jgi:dTDP-4-dehydrorhamnose 3,5-epimerase